MASIWRSIYRNASTRVLALLFLFFIALTSFLLVRSYQSEVSTLESAELTRLKSIANTLVSQIDGDLHQELVQRKPNQGDLIYPSEDDDYYQIYDALRRVKATNELRNHIYTITYEEDQKRMLFGVSSADTPFYRHQYERFPDELIQNYSTGGTLGQYQSENGTWLSAFMPILNSSGETIALLEVDQNFDTFIDAARASALKNIMWSMVVILFIGIIVFRAVKSILNKEEELNRELRASKEEIESKNQNITASIRYAKRIQQAVLPPLGELSDDFPGSFVFFRPRDIVSGDFYWWMEHESCFLLAVADCTGHGVPGAFMSMIGNTLLNEIVNKDNIIEPAEILTRLNSEIKTALKQSNDRHSSHDGMDIALVRIPKDKRSITFAGANRPLLIVRGDEQLETRGTRRPIGGNDHRRREFEQHTLPLEQDDWIYLYSDGFPDQFGGSDGKKFMSKPFKKKLSSLNGAKEHCINELDNVLQSWRSKASEDLPFAQTDDILVVGLKVP